MGTLPEHYRAEVSGEMEPNGSIPWFYHHNGRDVLVLVTACPCNDGQTRTVYLVDPETTEEFPEGIPAKVWAGIVPVEGKLFRLDDGYEFVSVNL